MKQIVSGQSGTIFGTKFRILLGGNIMTTDNERKQSANNWNDMQIGFLIEYKVKQMKE